MDTNAAAERIYEKIDSYMTESGNVELSENKQKEILIGVLKVVIEEIATLATIAALVQTKKAVDGAMEGHLKKLAIDANELYERMKKDGHI